MILPGRMKSKFIMDFPVFRAKVMQIGRNGGVRADLPSRHNLLEPENSRLLEALDSAKATNPTHKEVALIFRKNREEVVNV